MPYYSVKHLGSEDIQIWVQIQTELLKNIKKLPYPSKCEFPHQGDRTSHDTKIISLLGKLAEITN